MIRLGRAVAGLLAGSFLVVGCTGDDGAAGAPGAPGHDGKDGANAGKTDKWGVSESDPPGLVGRAVLPAATFAPGPPSGEITGGFWASQPVQGFSSLVDLGDGSFYTLVDNGFGGIENSADSMLRIYRVRPSYKTSMGGSGGVDVLSYIELRDPDKKVKFTIVNQFTSRRLLTGADFDPESLRVAADGTLWIGDEFGPFLLHFDPSGKLLDAPYPLPDFEHPGQFVRSPQNPWLEEASAIRVMNAAKAHGRAHGVTKTPVFSPWHVHVVDADNTGNRGFNTQRDNFDHPNTPGPNGNTGLQAANDEIVRLTKSPGSFPSIQAAGYPVVTWTVNDAARMKEMLDLGVNGIISDRPDILYSTIASYDANKDGKPGDLLDADGLIDRSKFDAQAHRGGRDLRPENTIPSYEVGLDNLIGTLEMDCGLTADNVPVMYHDRDFQGSLPGEPKKSRRKGGGALPVHIKDVTFANIQDPSFPILNDGVIRSGTPQTNDLALSPVSRAFWAQRHRNADEIYMMASLEQVFDFVDFYVDYYENGEGKTHPEATKRWKNASRIRFNIETKLDPRRPDTTKSPGEFVTAIAGLITARGLEDRADIQSFDFRTLLQVQERYPYIRTVYLFGDFSLCPTGQNAGGKSYCDDGTNFQPLDINAPVTESLSDANNTPWMAGMYWPYRRTTLDYAVRSQTSGGFEGLAVSPDGKKLYPLLEKPLTGAPAGQLLISEFDTNTRSFTGTQFKYQYGEHGESIGEFVLFTDKKGIIIERDGTQGDVNGWKRLFQVELPSASGAAVTKTDLVNLNAIPDTLQLSAGTGLAGDVGLGNPFSFPFQTIESVLVLGPRLLAVTNDNNYPGSIGRHKGLGLPDDNEFILVKLDHDLY
ncbi:esterase-like activity of phytase family protein [Pendulispora brunnea]|uniref:Esterase-like activity of phytase family protein n=1 Tax=Pendulispora brunnea TaxID=2905690 RepID=A0ABZ2K809_9BACT